MRVYRLTPSRQTNIYGFGFGSVPITALLVYFFQLVPVIFTYLRAVCPCDVKFLDLTSFRLLTGSGRVGHRVKSRRVGSRVKNHDPVPSLYFNIGLLISHDMEQNKVGPTLSRMGSESNKEPKPDGTQPSTPEMEPGQDF